VTAVAAVLVLNAFVLDPKSVIGGYRLDDSLAGALKVLSVASLVVTLQYNWFVSREDKRHSLYSGLAALAVGAALIGVTSYYVSLPTWGYAGTLLSLVAGTLAVGAVVLA